MSSGLSSNRAFTVTFDTIVLAIDPTNSSTPGQLHVENLVFPLAPGQICLLEHRRRGHHSDAFCTGILTSAHHNHNSVELLREVRCTGTVLCQACDFQSSLRGRPRVRVYTELITRRPSSERQRPREASDVQRLRPRLHRLCQIQSQPMHPAAFGPSRNRAATASRSASPDQVNRAR